MTGLEHRLSMDGWRQQRHSVVKDNIGLEVIPADAVEALFQEERDDRSGEKRQSRLLIEAAAFIPPRQERELAQAPTAIECDPAATKARENKTSENSLEQEEEQQQESTPRLSSLLRKHNIVSHKGTLPSFTNNFMQKDRNTPAGAPRPKAGNLWGEVFDALQVVDVLKNPITPAKKEACQLLRFFVFGTIGTEQVTTQQEADAVFHETIGTQEQVCTLHNLWQRLDINNSGRVDVAEFRAFATRHLQDKFEAGLPNVPSAPRVPDIWHNLRVSWGEDRDKVIARLCEKVELQLLGRKSSFGIDDMMRLIWLRAQLTDLRTMKAWCQEVVEEAARTRVHSPPALTTQEFEDLCTVFRHYDDAGSGEILFEDLVSKGLIYEDQVKTCKKEWDGNGNGTLGMREFCEMMCPAGYRASKESKIGTQKDGRRWDPKSFISMKECCVSGPIYLPPHPPESMD